MTMFSEEWIAARCEEDGDCLLWKLQVSDSKRPIYKPLQPDGRKPSIQVARKVWERKHGPIPPGMLITVSCGNPRCLEHLEMITTAERNSRQWRAQDNRARKTRAVTATGRKRAKLDMEKARYIRASDATIKEVAQELGVSFQLVSRVRRGVAWKDANPFGGLGARP